MSIYSAERLKIVSTDKKVLTDNLKQRDKLEYKKAIGKACQHCGAKIWTGGKKHLTKHAALCPTLSKNTHMDCPVYGDNMTQIAMNYDVTEKLKGVKEYKPLQGVDVHVIDNQKGTYNPIQFKNTQKELSTVIRKGNKRDDRLDNLGIK